MRIDRYVHDERLTWGAAGILLLVSAIHAAGIGRLLMLRPDTDAIGPPPVFEISLQRLPPPKLPQALERTPPEPNEAPREVERQKPRLTRPVPILVDTPTTDPVPPDTEVKQYEIGDELLPGVPGPAQPDGVPDGGTEETAAQGPVLARLRPIEVIAPVYPPHCRRMGIEGRVRVRVLVDERGRPLEVKVQQGSGNAALDDSALEAVRRWRFEPLAADRWVRIPIDFRIR